MNWNKKNFQVSIGRVKAMSKKCQSSPHPSPHCCASPCTSLRAFGSCGHGGSLCRFTLCSPLHTVHTDHTVQLTSHCAHWSHCVAHFTLCTLITLQLTSHCAHWSHCSAHITLCTVMLNILDFSCHCHSPFWLCAFIFIKYFWHFWSPSRNEFI